MKLNAPGLVTIALVAQCVCATLLRAQVMLRNNPPTRGVGLSVARDREAEAWLKKAAQAARDQDWKLLTDTIYRVVTVHGFNTVAEEGRDGADQDAAVFRSATAECWRILKAAGPEALDAFRLTYEAEAGRLLAEAEAAHDEALLRSAITRFLPTHAGTVAADTLATWLIDSGRWAEARRALDAVETFPTELVPAWSIALRQSVLLAIAGRKAESASVIDRLRQSPPADAPPDLADRITRVQAALAEPGRLRIDSGMNDWPSLLGRAESAGRMAPISIDISSLKPTRVELPGGQLIDVSAGLDLCVDQHRAPAWNAVSDGRTLFVATPNGFAAYDPVSLQCRWAPFQSAEKTRKQLAPLKPDRLRGFRNPPRNRPRLPLDQATQRAVMDETAGALSVFGGRVYCLEQVQLEPGQTTWDSEDEIVANTLSAYDAQSGKLLWQKGRSGPTDDELSGAHFLSAPIQAGRYVAALYAAGPDVMVLVMDRDGAIIRRAALGSIADLNFSGRRVLPMASTDGDLYVQTGMGRLFCFDVGDYSLRWASTYARLETIPDANVRFPGMVIEVQPQLDSWYASPPLIVGDLVVFAPQDSRHVLLGLDRVTGRRVWTAQRGGLRYLIGADERAVYAAGNTVGAYALSDGQRLWSYEDSTIAITGRAALVGDRILAPTRSGLLTLDAASGDRISLEQLSGESDALGNLLAIDGTLYSVELNAIRRYGDASQELTEAYNRMRAAPEDIDARIRTALLLVLRRNWSEAIALLDAPEMDPAGLEPTVRERVTHLIVVALLGQVREALSGAEGAEHTEVEPWLRRAGTIATHREDIVQIALARADQLVLKGNQTDACLVLLAAARDAGDAPVYRDEGWRIRASVHIGERLEKLWQSVAESNRDSTLTALRQTIAERADDGAAERLGDMADATGFCAIGAELDVRIAQRLLSESAPESAEFHLRRAISRPTTDATQIEALSRLVALLVNSGEGAIPRPTPASAFLALLSKFPPESAIPVDVARAVSAADATVAGFVDACHAAATPATPAPFPTDDSAYELTRQNRQDHPAPVGQVRSFGNATDELLKYTAILSTVDTAGDGMGAVLRGGTEGLIGVDLRPGQEARSRWQVELPLLPSDEVAISSYEVLSPTSRNVEPPAVCGSVAAIATSKGVYCLGLQSGAVLSRPIVPPTGRGANMPARAVVAAGDMFVVAADPRAIIGMPARAGAMPSWRRTFGGARILDMIAVGNGVVVMPANGDSAWVLDASTGRVTRRLPLEQPADPRAGAAADAVPQIVPAPTLVAMGDLLVVTSGPRVIAWSTTTGKQVWERRVPGGIREGGLLRMGPAHLGVSGDRRFQVLAVADGQPVGSVEVAGTLLPPIHASIVEGGRLVLALLTDESPQRQIRLEWYNLLSGRLLKKQGPWPTAVITPSMLDGSPDVVGVVENDIGQEEYAPMRGNQFRAMEGRAFSNVLRGCRLCLFTRKDGQRVGRPMEVSQTQLGVDRASPVVDLLVRDDQVVVVTEAGRQAIIVPRQ